MRRFALLLLSLAVATPASAQIAGRHDYGDVRTPERLGPDGRVPGPSAARESRAIRGEIRDLRDAGLLSRREARRMSREARALGHYGGASLSAGSSRAVTAQLLALRSQVQAASVRPERARRGRR